jgi:N-acetylmuramoyl-L-alanine amidase
MKFIIAIFCLVNLSICYSISPDERFQRTNNILIHFGVPTESDSQDSFLKLQEKSSLEKITNRIKFFDLNNSFEDFFGIVRSANDQMQFQAFEDKNSKNILDYSVLLSKDSNNAYNNFHTKILSAQKKSSAKQLSGIKIALDPGHMGGKNWDILTGNFVRDSKGNQLSEGLLTLEIALKLEEKLKELGAEVFITRRNIAPVTKEVFEDFVLRPYALNFLRESSLDEWFLSIIDVNYKEQSDLYTAFLSTEKFQRIFSEPMRWQFFMLDEDLNARANAINKFTPDITLIIHLDTDVSAINPNDMNSKNSNGTKAFVIGAFNKNEFSSREDRKFFGLHLLDTNAWDDSIKLSRSIISQIHSQMNIDYKSSSDEKVIYIEPGIYARNLYILRKLKPHVISYVECLYYNNPSEFYALTQEDQSIMINGKKYFYSNRLGLIVNSLSDGIVNFVQEYK